jgi:outer membrane lipoprotein SlyB
VVTLGAVPDYGLAEVAIMETGTKRKLHPLVATASVAVIILAGVGIAAFTGLLPTSRGSSAPAEQAAASTPAAPDSASAPAAPASASASSAQAAAQAPSSSASAASQKPASTPPVQVAESRPAQVAESRPRCLDCGVVEAVHLVEVKGQGTGIGAVAGGVAGALLGNQFGHGNGRTVMTLAGAAGGALAGNEVEKSARTTKHWNVSVRLESGATRVVSYASQPAWRPGDHVRVVNGALESLN